MPYVLSSKRSPRPPLVSVYGIDPPLYLGEPGRPKAGGGIGDLGGGSLEQPGQWLGAQWPWPHPLEVPRCPEPPGAPREAQGAELGRYPG